MGCMAINQISNVLCLTVKLGFKSADMSTLNNRFTILLHDMSKDDTVKVCVWCVVCVQLGLLDPFL